MVIYVQKNAAELNIKNESENKQNLFPYSFISSTKPLIFAQNLDEVWVAQASNLYW